MTFTFGTLITEGGGRRFLAGNYNTTSIFFFGGCRPWLAKLNNRVLAVNWYKSRPPRWYTYIVLIRLLPYLSFPLLPDSNIPYVCTVHRNLIIEKHGSDKRFRLISHLLALKGLMYNSVVVIRWKVHPCDDLPYVRRINSEIPSRAPPYMGYSWLGNNGRAPKGHTKNKVLPHGQESQDERKRSKGEGSVKWVVLGAYYKP